MRYAVPWNAVPCVGLIVLMGCLTLIIAPEYPELSSDSSSEIIAAAPRLPLIVIDPGHGGNDEGAKRQGVLEKTETLDIGLRLSGLLNEYHLKTRLTRDTDRYVSLPDRVAIANQAEDAIFVSLHFNESNDRTVEGVETFYCEQKVPAQQEWTWVGLFSNSSKIQDDQSEALAGYIQVALVAKTNTQDRGIKSRRLYVVRNTRCPSVLVEIAFLSNSMERQLLSNDDYRTRLAAGIAAGIVQFIKTQGQYSAPVLARAQ